VNINDKVNQEILEGELVEETEATGAGLIEGDLDELSLLSRERDDFKEMARRLQADFENYRKRVSRQEDEATSRAISEFVSKLLPSLDALEIAKEHLNPKSINSQESLALIKIGDLLHETLEKSGLESIKGLGELFDPNIHDAISRTENNEDESLPTVDKVLRTGYSWNGNVIRPAMVSVKG